MPTYARIDSGEVTELFTPPAEFAGTPIADLFHADVQWIDVTSVDPLPEARWTYDGHAFAPPAPPPPPTLQQQAMAMLGQPVTVKCTSLPACQSALNIDPRSVSKICTPKHTHRAVDQHGEDHRPQIAAGGP